MAKLYVIATPIGNLEDFSFRAARVLKEVDLVLCEDTRVTRKLLNKFNISTPFLSYHQHSSLKRVNHILNLLQEGKDLALVSDAGTPGVSDPGNKLIEEIVERLGKEVEIISVPGPSALTAAASVSGFPLDRFVFLGFPPAKRKRKKFFQEVLEAKHPVIIYESPHRIIRTLEELDQLSSAHSGELLKIVVCREVTKKFETIYRGNIKEVIEQIKDDKIKGEFVVIIKR